MSSVRSVRKKPKIHIASKQKVENFGNVLNIAGILMHLIYRTINDIIPTF